MWKASVDGQTLTFHLAGINNQNFLMRDEQTGSWWQQVSGEAIRGPLRGRRLREMPHEELTFAIWKTENPGGRVLRQDPEALESDDYAEPDWEEKMVNATVVTPVPEGDPLPARELVIGLSIGGASRAYPHAALRDRRVVMDELGGVPIAVVFHDDGKSVRVFDRRIAGRTLELLAVPDSAPIRIIDPETGSTWDFAGEATAGELAGRRLERLPILRDYWFDWRTYHPDTSVFATQ